VFGVRGISGEGVWLIRSLKEIAKNTANPSYDGTGLDMVVVTRSC